MEAIYLLIALNLLQFVYWSWQVHRLVNKLMSRNFAEYHAIVQGPIKDTPRAIPLEHVEEKHILEELNGMFPR